MPASDKHLAPDRDKSNTVAHTPAPWNFVLNHEGKPWLLNSGYAIVAYGVPGSEDGGQICEVSVQSKPKRGEGWRHDCPVRDANARLIAAAPDLLEALKHVNYLLNELADERTPANIEMTPAEAELVAFRKHTAAAISRAEGAEQ